MVHTYTKPPAGETQFALGAPYFRQLWRCPNCLHMMNCHAFDLSNLYDGSYALATYTDLAGIRGKFGTIEALPPDQSDNYQRCGYINRWWQQHRDPINGSLLDVGSGIGVFPYRMKEQYGWTVTTVDADPLFVAHAKELGLEAIQADWVNVPPVPQGFDLVTMVHIIEHVENPIAFLSRAKLFLSLTGAVYVEVPSVEAFKDGPGREEFHVPHEHVFSSASLSMVARRAGFVVQEIQQGRSCSGKYDLRCFLAVA